MIFFSNHFLGIIIFFSVYPFPICKTQSTSLKICCGNVLGSSIRKIQKLLTIIHKLLSCKNNLGSIFTASSVIKFSCLDMARKKQKKLEKCPKYGQI